MDPPTNSSNTVEIFEPPVIIDTLPKREEFKSSYAINITASRIETVMPFGDSCIIKNSSFNIWDTTNDRISEQRSDDLQVLVDTSQFVTLKYDKYRDYYRLDDTTQVYYKGLPCFIYNETPQIRWLMTQDSKVIVIQQALDSNNNWRPIQIWNWSWCGNSFYRACIKPKNYLLFKIPLYKGNYYTDLRLKIYSKDALYYSNNFKGWVDYRQFDLPEILMDKKGEPRFNLSFLTDD